MIQDFPGGPVVKNLPCNAGDMGLIPGWGTKTPHTEEELSPLASQLESPRVAWHNEDPCATTKTVNKYFRQLNNYF